MLAKRQMEGLALYEALPHIEPFHACDAPDRILRGSNRGGKTLAGCVELARAVLGKDPYDKYPKTDGRCFIVGKDGKHLSEVLHRKLFRPGAFKMIRDLETGKWRTWRPWEPADKAREKEVKDAPPLIPKRMIVDMSWESAKEQQPTLARLSNGWEIRFFSSLGAPPQGSDIDLAWFDEEIVNQEWYPEISARLIDRKGKFIWSATAQLGGAQLYDLCLIADELRGTKRPRIVEFFAHINDNQHFTDEQRELFFAKLTEEQRRIRIEGEFAFTSFKVYPEFSVAAHCVEAFDIPSNWTRYLVVDPGRQICAVLFAAVPPPKHENAHKVYLYDELYIKNCNAKMFGQAVRDKTDGNSFRAFIIDYRGSRIRLMDSGLTVEQQYGQALKDYNVKSETTGHGFVWANDEVEAGVMQFRSWINSSKDKSPRLAVFKGRLPNLEYEIQRYHYKRSKDGLTDKPELRHNHLMDCCRYLAMYDPKYHQPKRRPSEYNPYEHVKAKLKRKREKEGPPYISLG